MLFRYPGSKNKMAKPILAWLRRHIHEGVEYREPFFGGGAVGLALLQSKPALRSVWFNDNDATLCCVWRSVAQHTERLEEWVRWYKRCWLDMFQIDRVPGIHPEPRFKGRPDDSDELKAYLNLSPKERAEVETPPDYIKYVEDYLDMFYHQQKLVGGMKEVPVDYREMVDVAWKKIALHQTSYSGLGTGGGPIGGKEQRSNWIMGCRYTPETTCKKIRQIKGYFDSVEMRDDVCSHGDFGNLLSTPGDAVFYLDPPYYEQGPKLYRDSFGVADHKRLADALRAEDRPWLLSYDNHEAVRGLYDGMYMREFDLRYTIVRYKKTEERPDREVTKTELVISNRPFAENEFSG